MQNLFVLSSQLSFTDLARAFADSALVLTDVASCTFPSRPEPKSAHWLGPNHRPWLVYGYEPEFDLRWLLVLNWTWLADPVFAPPVRTPDESGEQADDNLIARASRRRAEQVIGERSALDPALGEGSGFVSWSELRRDLASGNHLDVRRAAAAFRVAALNRHHCAATLAEDALIDALRSSPLLSQRAAAEQLIGAASERARAVLEDAAQSHEDLDVRLHAHRALQAIESRRWTR